MVRQIEPQTLAQKLTAHEPVHLLDVRQEGEHDFVALPNSQLIPLHELPQRVDELEIAKDAEIVVYCHHGIRSLSGAAYLEQLGYQKVYSLAGGIDAWSLTIDPKVPRY